MFVSNVADQILEVFDNEGVFPKFGEKKGEVKNLKNTIPIVL